MKADTFDLLGMITDHPENLRGYPFENGKSDFNDIGSKAFVLIDKTKAPRTGLRVLYEDHAGNMIAKRYERKPRLTLVEDSSGGERSFDRDGFEMLGVIVGALNSFS